MSSPHFGCWNIYSSGFTNELIFHSWRTKGKTLISSTPKPSHNYFHYKQLICRGYTLLALQNAQWQSRERDGWQECPPCCPGQGKARDPSQEEQHGPVLALGTHRLPDGSEGAATGPVCSPGAAPAAPTLRAAGILVEYCDVIRNSLFTVSKSRTWNFSVISILLQKHAILYLGYNIVFRLDQIRAKYKN